MPELKALLASNQTSDRGGRSRGQGGGAGNAAKRRGERRCGRVLSEARIAPAWLDGDKPADIAERAIEALAAADDHALRPDDYEYQALSQDANRWRKVKRIKTRPSAAMNWPASNSA